MLTDKITDAELEEMIRLVDKGKVINPHKFRKLWTELKHLRHRRTEIVDIKEAIENLALDYTELVLPEGYFHDY